jgi:predicted PurR-regulated permease PerM
VKHNLLTWSERGRLWLRIGIRVIGLVIAVLLIVYALPPLLSLFLPFVLGLIVAWLLNPMIRWIQRKLSISRKVISLVVIILIFCIIGSALFGLVWAAVSEVRSLVENWGSVTEAILGILGNVNQWLHSLERFLPQGVTLDVDGLFGALAGWLEGLDVSGWLTKAAGKAPDVVSAVTGFAIAAVVFIMASYFITGDYPRLRFLVTDRMPAHTREFCGKVKNIFMEAFGGYIRSQLILTLGVFVILALGFAITGQSYGLVLTVVFATAVITSPDSRPAVSAGEPS